MSFFRNSSNSSNGRHEQQSSGNPPTDHQDDIEIPLVDHHDVHDEEDDVYAK